MKNTTKFQGFPEFVFLSLKWLVSSLKKEDQVPIGDFSIYLGYLQRVEKTRGKRALFAFSKAVRLNVMNYLSGNPERDTSVRLTPRERLPICLGPLLKYIIDETPTVRLRLVMTILFSTRALRSEAEPDLESIVLPPKSGYEIDSDLVTQF